MSAENFFKEAIEIAFSKLEEAGGNAQKLPPPLQALAVVISVQGLTEYGGLAHFFTWNFSGSPSYVFFYQRL